jgi:GTP cyclohydrolase I
MNGNGIHPPPLIHPPITDADRSLLAAIRICIAAIDPDPSREGLQETPERVLRFYREWAKDEPFNLTTFDAEGYDQMIVQRQIPFYSLCEHHLLPFFGTATVAYVPNEKIVGLSKLARTVQHFARRPQNQERITRSVAHLLDETLRPKGVAVVLRARHLCMEMRGVRVPGAETVTSALLGVFLDKPEARAELLDLERR